MDKKIQIIPYLTFNGHCDEALKLYVEALAEKFTICPDGRRRHMTGLASGLAR